MNPKSGFAVFKTRFFYVLFGVLVGVLLSSTFAFAEGNSFLLGNNQTKIMVNGKLASWESPPHVMNGEIWAPLKNIAEALGCSIDWNVNANELDITCPNNTSNLSNTNSNATNNQNSSNPVSNSSVQTNNTPIQLIVDGIAIQSDVPSQIFGNRVFIPARALATALGAQVNWDSTNYIVSITSNTNGTIFNQPTSSNFITITTYKGLDAIIVNGVTYFNADEYSSLIQNSGTNSSSYITFNNNSEISTIVLNGETTVVPFNEDNVQMYNGSPYFNINYYKEP